MAQPGLKEYIDSLSTSEILTINETVPRDEFISSFVMELDERKQTPVVRFNHVEDSAFPVVANLFASRERMASMIGTTLPDMYLRWREVQSQMFDPVIVDNGPIYEVIESENEVDVERLPISVHFRSDAGRYISSGIVVAKDPDTGTYNLSYHRMQMKDKNRFGVSLHSRGHLWDYFRRSREKGKDLEVAIIIGAHPLLYLAAGSKMGIDQDEYALAGGLYGEGIELVPCKTVDIDVPANAEIVLEGVILADTFEDEGPFCEYTGYSTSRSTRNVLQITGIMRRKNPLFLDLIPGYSNEHMLLGSVSKEVENMAILKDKFPMVLDVNLPKSGTHFHAFVKLRKTIECQPRQIMILLAGLDPYLKTIIAVDEDIDIYDEEEVLWAMATRMQPHKDALIIPDMMCNALDPSSEDGISSKLLIDATQPLDSESVQTCIECSDIREKAKNLLERIL